MSDARRQPFNSLFQDDAAYARHDPSLVLTPASTMSLLDCQRAEMEAFAAPPALLPQSRPAPCLRDYRLQLQQLEDHNSSRRPACSAPQADSKFAAECKETRTRLSAMHEKSHLTSMPGPAHETQNDQFELQHAQVLRKISDLVREAMGGAVARSRDVTSVNQTAERQRLRSQWDQEMHHLQAAHEQQLIQIKSRVATADAVMSNLHRSYARQIENLAVELSSVKRRNESMQETAQAQKKELFLTVEYSGGNVNIEHLNGGQSLIVPHPGNDFDRLNGNTTTALWNFFGFLINKNSIYSKEEGHRAMIRWIMEQIQDGHVDITFKYNNPPAAVNKVNWSLRGNQMEFLLLKVHVNKDVSTSPEMAPYIESSSSVCKFGIFEPPLRTVAELPLDSPASMRAKAMGYTPIDEQLKHLSIGDDSSDEEPDDPDEREEFKQPLIRRQGSFRDDPADTTSDNDAEPKNSFPELCMTLVESAERLVTRSKGRSGKGSKSRPIAPREPLCNYVGYTDYHLCYVVIVNGVHVSRRIDNGMINGSNLIKLCRSLNPEGFRLHEDELPRDSNPRQDLFGSPRIAWISYALAKEIVRRSGLTNMLYPLFNHDVIGEALAAAVRHDNEHQKTCPDSQVLEAKLWQQIVQKRCSILRTGEAGLRDCEVAMFKALPQLITKSVEPQSPSDLNSATSSWTIPDRSRSTRSPSCEKLLTNPSTPADFPASPHRPRPSLFRSPPPPPPPQPFPDHPPRPNLKRNELPPQDQSMTEITPPPPPPPLPTKRWTMVSVDDFYEVDADVAGYNDDECDQVGARHTAVV